MAELVKPKCELLAPLKALSFCCCYATWVYLVCFVYRDDVLLLLLFISELQNRSNVTRFVRLFVLLQTNKQTIWSLQFAPWDSSKLETGQLCLLARPIHTNRFTYKRENNNNNNSLIALRNQHKFLWANNANTCKPVTLEEIRWAPSDKLAQFNGRKCILLLHSHCRFDQSSNGIHKLAPDANLNLVMCLRVCVICARLSSLSSLLLSYCFSWMPLTRICNVCCCCWVWVWVWEIRIYIQVWLKVANWIQWTHSSKEILRHERSICIRVCVKSHIGHICSIHFSLCVNEI